MHGISAHDYNLKCSMKVQLVQKGVSILQMNIVGIIVIVIYVQKEKKVL